jgi:hypothetical protein
MRIAPSLSRRRWIQWLSALMILSLILPNASAVAAPSHQAQDEATAFRSCANIDEDRIQDELNRVVQQIFGDVRAKLDLEEIVERQWTATGMDAALDKAVEAGVESARRETNGWDKFVTAWSPAAAEELAGIVAKNTFTSAEFTTAFEHFSNSVADEIELALVEPAAKSYSQAIYCLQTFLGARYSQAMVQAFQESLKGEIGGVDGITISPAASDLIESHIGAITGIGVMIVTQLTRKLVAEMLEEVGERIVGSLGKRIAGNVMKRILGAGTKAIPIVGWTIGVILTFSDLLNSLDGSLPIIKEILLAPETKAHIRSQVVLTLDEELELAEKVPAIARQVADKLYDEWRIMRGKMRKVLDLCERDETFCGFFEAIESGESLKRLLEIADVLPVESLQTTLDDAIENGALAEALALPSGVVTIVQDTGSLETAVAWGKLAGSRLNDVARLKIHEIRTPEEFDPEHLEGILALDNKALAAKALVLTNEQLDVLISLPLTVFNDLVTLFEAKQLGWLADRLPEFSSSDRNTIVNKIRSEPALLNEAIAKGTVCGVLLDCQESSVLALANGGAFGWLTGFWATLTGASPLRNFMVWSVVAFLAILVVLSVIGMVRRFSRYAFGSIDKHEHK